MKPFCNRSCLALAVLVALFMSACGGPSEMTPEQARKALFNREVPVPVLDDQLLKYVETEDAEVVGLLLQAGLSPDGGRHGPHLCVAFRISSTEMVKLLLEHGANPNLETYQGSGQSLLSNAVDLANVEIMRLLLDHGADPNGLETERRPPIFYATERNSLEKVKLLLDRGAKTDVVDTGGDTVLTIAAAQLSQVGASTELFDLLWITGADPKKGALVCAVASAPDDVFEKVIASGADVNKPDRGGFTALMGAATDRKTARVRRLVELGADVNVADDSGRTALWYVAYAGSSSEARNTFQVLLDAGAKTDITNREGKRLIDELPGSLRSMLQDR